MFKEFPKISRLSRDMIITEKLDGTNACVVVGEDGSVVAQSRTRIVTPAQDNYGFAAWVEKNRDELRLLGPGYHFGEWWGQGIQRNYGLAEKRFSLFNVSRWTDDVRPPCCHVVPTLLRWTFDTGQIDATLAILEQEGSRAAPGFMKPEGVVVFHTHSSALFKKTIEKDSAGKGFGA